MRERQTDRQIESDERTDGETDRGRVKDRQRGTERERERGYVTYTCPMPSCSEVLSLGFPQTSVPVILMVNTQLERRREREQENTIQ